MNELIKKYLENIATQAELKILLKWMKHDNNYKEFLKTKKQWKEDLKDDNVSPQTEKGLINFQSFMLKDSVAKTNKILRIKRIYKFAAIVMLFIICGGGFYLSKFLPQDSLTTKITADKGYVASITLPDSSKVWLNSGSTIEYSNTFGNIQRSLKIDGQAYFEVVKNKKIPFIVKSKNINVKVLGTRFTVDAYKDAQNTSVILEEGSVELSISHHPRKKLYMKPGDKIVYNADSDIAKKTRVKADRYSSWRNGILNFYNSPMKEVIQKLSNRYNYEFKLDKVLEDMEVTFTVKQEDLSSVLELLSTITPVNIESKGDSVMIKPYSK